MDMKPLLKMMSPFILSPSSQPILSLATKKKEERVELEDRDRSIGLI